MNQIKKLVFVYNAGSGVFNQLSDFAHKLLSPQTYPCNLCKLTHENLVMKREWKEYLAKLPYQKEFLHKDKFIKTYPNLATVALPAIFLTPQNQTNILVNVDEINAAATLTDLQLLLMDKLTKSIKTPNIT